VASKGLKKFRCAGCGKGAKAQAKYCVRCGKPVGTPAEKGLCLTLSKSVPGIYGESDPRVRERMWKSFYGDMIRKG
jgi:hypothetical protein